MSETETQNLSNLEQSLKEVNNLRQSGWISMILMIVGVGVVIGSLIFSIYRLQPLEQQVKDAEAEIEELGKKRNELTDEIKNAQTELEEVRNQVSSARKQLEDGSKSTAPSNDNPKLTNALTTLRGAEEELNKVNDDSVIKATRTPVPKPSAEPVPSRPEAISNLFSNRGSVRVKTYSVIMNNYGADPQLIPELLSYARANRNNDDGIYNTLVVLSHLNRDRLRCCVGDIKAFANEVEPSGGDRIKERVRILLSRLPE